MTLFTPPTHKLIDEDTGAARLTFGRGSLLPDGPYCVRGGVCWPGASDEMSGGYAVLCARHEASGRVWVVREAEFIVMVPVVSEHGVVEPYPYLAAWLSAGWSEWLGYTYYWRQDGLTAKQYRLEAQRCGLIQPKPSFPELHWTDGGAALAQVYLLVNSDKLKFEGDGGVDRAGEERRAKPDGFYPALHALTCAVVGLARKRAGVGPEERMDR